MTCATSSAVVAMGAGLIPAVIRVRTKPGRTISTLAPEPTSELASPWAKASRPALDEPYTKLARRVRSPATEDSTTRTPWPWRRSRFPQASIAAAGPVKLVVTISPTAAGSFSTASWSPRTPAATRTRSMSP